MALTPEQQKIEDHAIQFARKNKKTIAEEFTDVSKYGPEKESVSVFMAGAPGAGKTETSIELLDKNDSDILRIDPDELRLKFTEHGYNGSNSFLFQKAVSILVEKIHDLALKQDQSFLLDGTLSHYYKAKENIERSLKRDRTVQILYVYQEPRQAWYFVIARESKEGRRIEPKHFIEQYFKSREAVNQLKVQFGRDLIVNVLQKNTDNTNIKLYKANVDKIDHHIPEQYTVEDIRKITKEIKPLPKQRLNHVSI